MAVAMAAAAVATATVRSRQCEGVCALDQGEMRRNEMTGRTTIHAENTTIHAAPVAIALLLPLPDMVPDQCSKAASWIKYRSKIVEIL